MTAEYSPRRYAGVPTAVLGADGFIGRWVARALSSAGADLHLVVVRRAEAEPVLSAYAIRGRVHEADLTDAAATQRLMGRLAPAVVFNLVGYGVAPREKSESSARLAALLNAELPGILAESLPPHPAPGWEGRRIVHAGSIFEYGNIGGHLEETAVPAPSGLYGTSKLAGTLRLGEACRTRGLDGVTARLCQVFGPGEHPGRLLPQLLALRQTPAPLQMTIGTQLKDFTYVEDVAEGLLRLGVSSGPPGEVVNLATGKLTTVRDFTLQAAHLLRLDLDLLRFEKPLPDNELHHATVATERLRRLTGWVPTTSVAEGIRKTMEFLEQQGER